MKQSARKHIPVLLKQVVDGLQPKEGESYLDLTAGYGGHASAILERTKSYNKAVLVDRDSNAIEYLQNLFVNKGTHFIHQDFGTAAENLAKTGQQFDLIVADLGISSPHIDEASRGFSFRLEGSLDMRMDQRQTLTAADLANKLDEEELVRILRVYGEEPHAIRYAKAIIHNRPVETTTQLAEIISSVAVGRHLKVHPATRTFQALRIATNDEIKQLQTLLDVVSKLLAPAGRLGIISFHSLEDRLVKEFCREYAADGYDSELRELTKKPIVATEDELAFNPRSRSAKLRIVAKK